MTPIVRNEIMNTCQHIAVMTPFGFSEIGQRPNNEDFVYPKPGEGTALSRLFMVCDGMGGADKGEEASRMVGEGLAAYFQRKPTEELTEDYLSNALHAVHEEMVEYLRHNPLVSRMGTTLALVYLHPGGASVAHIGDSRVYFIRKGQILFKTRDHKQVNDMVDAGILTSEQAESHPWRNKLSRAIMAYSSTESTTRGLSTPDLLHIPDLQPDDYFFLCSDGVLENIKDKDLEVILGSQISDKEKGHQILSYCQDRTKDNYSGYLIRIDSVRAGKT